MCCTHTHTHTYIHTYIQTYIHTYNLKILDEEFPKNHVFHNILNRNTVNISYSGMPNLEQKIDGANKSILKACNGRRPADWPMARDCLRSFMIYQGTVTMEDSKPDQTYVVLMEISFKMRFANHKSSYKDPSKRLSTEPSKHVWCSKEAKLKFRITWKILKQTTPFSSVLNCCNLCLWEKYFIIHRHELATLKKRNEVEMPVGTRTNFS